MEKFRVLHFMEPGTDDFSEEALSAIFEHRQESAIYDYDSEILDMREITGQYLELSPEDTFEYFCDEIDRDSVTAADGTIDPSALAYEIECGHAWWAVLLSYGNICFLY